MGQNLGMENGKWGRFFHKGGVYRKKKKIENNLKERQAENKIIANDM